MEKEEKALELINVHKHFGGIYALRGIHFEVEEGEVHALVGENGAGKSTLIKIITGVHPLDEGEIYLFGKRVKIENPIVARQRGIVAIYQESSLIENFTVAQNIFLGHEIQENRSGWLMEKMMVKESQELMEQFPLSIDPLQKVKNIGLGDKRIVEILKALSNNAQIFIMDEPTAGMSKIEIENFFKIVRDLKKRRKTVIYISHHLEEIFQIADRVTVLRDGENVGTHSTKDIQISELVRMMIGRNLESEFPKRFGAPGDKVLLEVKNFFSERMLAPISFSLRSGEILGITGIIGSGKSELGLALFGADPKIQGKVFVDAREVRFGSPLEAKKMGIGFIPEDRKGQGLFLGLSVDHNITVVALHQLERFGVLSLRKKKRMALSIAQSLKLNPLRIELPVHSLSGGNQQKIVLGKWFYRRPKILILDEPTRGVDVGAKREIYRLIRKWADQGVAVLLLSSEFKEVHEVCDRILVLYRGDLLKEIDPKRTTTEKIMSMALGEHV